MTELRKKFVFTTLNELENEFKQFLTVLLKVINGRKPYFASAYAVLMGNLFTLLLDQYYRKSISNSEIKSMIHY